MPSEENKSKEQKTAESMGEDIVMGVNPLLLSAEKAETPPSKTEAIARNWKRVVMWHWLRKLFGSADAIPADVARLPSTSERALSSSLNNLRSEERGWTTLSEAIRLFSNEAPDYAVGEMDAEGKRRLGEFASECRCEVQFMPTEGRVYFRHRS